MWSQEQHTSLHPDLCGIDTKGYDKTDTRNEEWQQD